MQIGQTIKRLREERNLSQSQLARSLDIQPCYVSKLENNKADYPPSDRVLRKLSKQYQLDYVTLVLQCDRIPDTWQQAIARHCLKNQLTTIDKVLNFYTIGSVKGIR